MLESLFLMIGILKNIKKILNFLYNNCIRENNLRLYKMNDINYDRKCIGNLC